MTPENFLHRNRQRLSNDCNREAGIRGKLNSNQSRPEKVTIFPKIIKIKLLIQEGGEKIATERKSSEITVN